MYGAQAHVADKNYALFSKSPTVSSHTFQHHSHSEGLKPQNRSSPRQELPFNSSELQGLVSVCQIDILKAESHACIYAALHLRRITKHLCVRRCSPPVCGSERGGRGTCAASATSSARRVLASSVMRHLTVSCQRCSQLPFKVLLSPVAGGELISCRLPLAACRLPPAACRLPLAACRLPLAACRLPLAACRLPPAACRLPLAACRLPPAACRLPRPSLLTTHRPYPWGARRPLDPTHIANKTSLRASASCSSACRLSSTMARVWGDCQGHGSPEICGCSGRRHDRDQGLGRFTQLLHSAYSDR